MQTGGDRKLHIWLVRIRRWYLAQEMCNSDQMKIPPDWPRVVRCLVSIGLEGRKRAKPYARPARDRCRYQLWRPVQRKVLIPALEESLRSQRTLG